MTDQEKLMRLIDEAADITPVSHGGQISYYLDSEKIADHLIAHGVTVREMQKPIRKGYLLENSPCWFEEVYENGTYALEIVEITKGTGPNYYSYSIGSENADLHDGQLYGKTWRCWAEKPTEEERTAAEWGK